MTAAHRIPSADSARRAFLAKVHIARKELGLQEPEYRAMLARLTGHESAGDCTLAELRDVLDELKAKGWTPKVFVSRNDKQAAAGRRPADSPMARKARAMWISLAQLGAVRNGSDQALEAFARRQLKTEAMAWADQGQCYKLIEALKAMAERAGWPQHMPTSNSGLGAVILRRRLIGAMRRKLGLPDDGEDVSDPAEVIADLAARIRALPSEPEA